MRFKPSQGKDNVYYHHANTFHGANGAEPTQTNRDPTSFKYSDNVFKSDYWEWRMRAGDYLYQMGANLSRSNDAWTRCLLGYMGFSFMMLTQAPIWKLHFAFTTLATAARIRDRSCEPSIDEVWVLDTVFKNEKLRSLFNVESYHVIDFD